MKPFWGCTIEYRMLMSGGQVKETKAKGPLPSQHRDHGEVMALHSSRPCSNLSVSGDGKAVQTGWAVKVWGGCGWQWK